MSRMATDISVADHLPHGRGANIAILGNRGLALFCRYGLANSPDRWRISRAQSLGCLRANALSCGALRFVRLYGVYGALHLTSHEVASILSLFDIHIR